MKRSNNQKIVNILKRKSPLLSDQIIKQLCSRYNLTEQAAIKAISRTSDPIKKVDCIRFSSKKFFYLNELDYKTKNELYKFCNKHNTAEGLILNALMVRGGMCLAKYLPIISGLPVKKVNNQKTFEDVVSCLEKIGMIHKYKDEELSEEVYYLYKKKDSNYSKSKFFLLLEDKILEQLKVLFIKLNFTSTGSVKIRCGSEIPIYGNFNWSLVGPCYLDGVKIGNKNGILCCDIFLGGRLNSDNIKPILRKYGTSKAQKRNTRIIPAIFFQSMKKSLLEELRGKGFLTISTKTFGGDKLLECLEELASFYSKIHNQSNMGQETGEIIKKLFNLNFGNNNNIRGHLFNFIVKSIFDLKYRDVEMNKKVQHNYNTKEIDIYFEDQQFRYVVECKAWSNFRNKKTEIKSWLDKKYTFFEKWNDQKNGNKPKKKLKVYFIVSIKDQEEIKKIHRQFKNFHLVTFYDQTFLDDIAKQYRQKEIRSALKYFLNT